jgi:hypothetical protein
MNSRHIDYDNQKNRFAQPGRNSGIIKRAVQNGLASLPFSLYIVFHKTKELGDSHPAT